MTKFALEHIPEVRGRIKFYYLLMEGQNQFLEMLSELKTDGGYDSELRTIQARMQDMAELKFLPKTKCRDITPAKSSAKQYELKTKHLRCYLFHEEHNGRIVVMLGKKTTQDKDIKKFQKITKEYLNAD